jgi:AraC-like DNA-binding protein
MQGFYRKALLGFVALVVASALLAWFCIHQSHPAISLLPFSKRDLPWRLATAVDAAWGGTSTIRVHDRIQQSLRLNFRLTDAAEYPFVAAELLFENGKGNPDTVDLSRYSSVTFLAKCTPANTLIFSLATFDERFSKPGQFSTYPSPMTYFSCNEKGVPVTLDMTRLTIPIWWFYQMNRDLTHQSYDRKRVAKFIFGVSSASPRQRDSQVEISQLTLHGHDRRYMVGLSAALAAGLCAFALWFFRAHSRALALHLESQLKKDLQFVAYRQLTLEPFKDREKAALLRYIATHYTDPELRLEGVVAGAGVSRNKINEVLKSELSMTFVAYLNKLRLTEAARLLTEQSDATIAEIAYSVGYGSVSYFNKLFKEEYGCTPKMFRGLAPVSATPSVPASP